MQSFLLLGQTTINRNHYFTLGNSYPFMFLDSLNVDTIRISGSNVVWNFSNAIQVSTQDTLHVIDPSTTIFFNAPNTNYNISNLCFYEPLGIFSYYDEMYSYFVSDTSSIHYIGNWANNGIYESGYFHYSDTDKVYSFPFSFNQNFIDSFIGSSIDFSGGGYHAYHGNRFTEADAFGTLILPTATYSNCLRIRSIRHMNDSALFLNFNWTDTTYTWFQLNTNGYILKIENDFGSKTNKYYYSNPLISSLTENNFDNRLSIFPNPCASNISFQWNGNLRRNASITIRNVLGQTVWHDEIGDLSTLVNNIDVGTFLHGWYTLEIKTPEMSRIGKFIKE